MGNSHLPINDYLFNAIPGNHLVLAPDSPVFTVMAVSDDYLAAIGLKRESTLGRSLFDVFFQDSRNQAVAAQLRQSLDQVLATRQTHLMADLRFEWAYKEPGLQEWRTWRPINKPVAGNDGNLAYILHTVEDVTSEVRLMEIAQVNAYLQTIINLFNAPLQVLQPVIENGEIIDFRFRLTNQAYAAYASTTPEQLQGKRVSEVFPGYLETASFTNPVETFKTGQPLTFEVHYNKDGFDLYNLMSTVKLADEVVVHFTDFTQMKQLQNQLENKIDELNHSNASLKQFTYIASHDLQEPLRKIQSFSAMLFSQLHDQLTDNSRHYLQRISDASARMSTLITDLLTYSRMSSRQQEFSPVSLAAVIADVLTTLDLTISEEEAQVDVETLPTVNGDAVQLEQLFQNLLSNALKFSRPNERPRVEVSSVLLPRNELPVSIKPSSLSPLFHRISVRDEGIGFDLQYKDRIFLAFQRLHTKQAYAGTGVGLAICQQVVNNHGGSITATSQPGKGSTFWVYLPAEYA